GIKIVVIRNGTVVGQGRARSSIGHRKSGAGRGGCIDDNIVAKVKGGCGRGCASRVKNTAGAEVGTCGRSIDVNSVERRVNVRGGRRGGDGNASDRTASRGPIG